MFGFNLAEKFLVIRNFNINQKIIKTAYGTTGIGLDLGDDDIILAQLEKVGDNIRLKYHANVPLPADVLFNGAIMDKNKLVDVIGGLINNTNLAQKDTAFAIRGHQVMLRTIDLPKDVFTEGEDTLKWEVGQHVPFDMDTIHINMHVLTPQASTEENQKVMLAAVKKDLVEEYTQIVKEAGANVSVIDIEPFSAANVSLFNKEELTLDSTALFKVERNRTSIIVFNQGSVYMREIGVGSDKDTDTLIRELSRFFDVYVSLSGNPPMERILFCSAHGNRGELKQKMTAEFEMTTEILDPLKNIVFDRDQFPDSAIEDIKTSSVTALGLALRSLEDDGS
ncbi:MAG: pilus assembly protein PilM [Candidatus Aminicenantes bacterium]|nr:pilus assembly protein PilM [Candidatus Aminicenantes bacterium]